MTTLRSIVAAAALMATPAFAGDGTLYCEEPEIHCYRVQPRDEPGRDRWRSAGSWYSHYGDGEDYGRGRQMVCDPDGDRCYLSRGWRWSHREYYRLLGYRWSN